MKPAFVYVAGNFKAQDRLRKEAETLLMDGRFVVTSAWLWEPAETHEYAWRAGQDKCQVLSSNFFILDTLDADQTGGREVELGLALNKGMQVILIGPIRNIFHNLIGWKFANWNDFHAILGRFAFSETAIQFRATVNSNMM